MMEQTSTVAARPSDDPTAVTQMLAMLLQLPALVGLMRGPEMKFELANERYQALLGGRSLVGRTLREAIPELEGQGFIEILERVYATGEPFVGNEMLARIDVDGSGALEDHYFNCVYQPYRSAGREVDGVIAFGTEVTELVKARLRSEAVAAELDRQGVLFRTLTNNTDAALFLMNDQQKCTFMNAAAEHLTGFTLAEVLALDKPLHDIIHHLHPDGRPYPRMDCPIDRALPRRTREKGEDVFVHKTGRFYPVAFTASPIIEAERAVGTVIEVRGTAEEKRANAILAEQQERSMLINRATNDPIWDWDFRTDLVVWNEAVAKVFGYPPSEVAPTSSWWVEHIHPDDRDRIIHSIHEVIDGTGEVWSDEYRFKRRDGSYAVVLDRGYVARAPDGKAYRMVGSMLDMTERKRMQAALEEHTQRLLISEERYRSLVDATSQMVWTNSPEGQMVGDQPGWAAFTGQSEAQYRGFGWSDAVHPDDRAHTIELWNRALETRTTFLCEHRVRRHDGVYRRFTIRAVPVCEASGAIREWVGIHTDVTEQREMEEQRERLVEALARSNAELDQFAYVASHDLKAPLRGIASLSQFIEEDLGGALSGDTRKNMDLLRGRVHRLEALINGILDYSRAGRVGAHTETVDVRKMFDETIELLAPPPDVTIRVGDRMPVLQTERTPFQQVFMNLISNAIKYAGRPDIQIQVDVSEEEQHYRFSVADNGNGIAKEFHDRIWGIFQTLQPRDVSGGTGIGLSVVKKIVETRGGRVWVESEEGKGATFYVDWPKHLKAVESAA